MNFDFPDDMKTLRDEAQKFLADRCPRSVPRRILESDEPYDKALWQEMAGLGWVGASVPEEYGGVGLGHLAVCVLAEELGRALAPVPYASTVYGAIEALLVAGSEEQKQRFLPSLASGERIGTLALAERPGTQDFSAPQMRIASDGRLTGTKLAVPDGDSADIAIVAASDPSRGATLAIVDLTGPGIRRETVKTFDPTRSHANLHFESAAAEPLGQGRGDSVIRRVIDRAAIMMAFEQLGGAEAALYMARDYALERYAFGRPIGSFQAIKHKLADIYAAVEIARSNTYYGAWALSTNAAELPIAAAVARISASDAGWVASKENVQTHGGMGYTWEGDAHLFYRRAKLLGLTLGSSREWKQRLVRELKTSNASAAPAAG
ncbi:MAG: acyl-CoA dehydrogenase family protein [Hyphomicrobiaceae bacterium]